MSYHTNRQILGVYFETHPPHSRFWNTKKPHSIQFPVISTWVKSVKKWCAPMSGPWSRRAWLDPSPRVSISSLKPREILSPQVDIPRAMWARHSCCLCSDDKTSEMRNCSSQLEVGSLEESSLTISADKSWLTQRDPAFWVLWFWIHGAKPPSRWQALKIGE